MTRGKRLVYLRRISQVLFFLLFIVIIGQTRNHTFIEEERTSRLEEHNTTYYTHTQKSFPFFVVTGILSLVTFAGIFLLARKKKVSVKSDKKILGILVITGIIFILSLAISILLGKGSFYSVSRGSPAIRIPVSPVFAWTMLLLCTITFILSCFLFIKKLIKKTERTTWERWLFFSGVLLFSLTLIIIFSIGSYHPDPKYFKASVKGVPFFSFDKFLYNLDVPSTLFMETSALIGITTSIAARTLTVSIVYIFVMLILAFIFGRAFCGWACPFGTMHHAVSWFKQRFRAKKFPQEPFRKWQRLKYVFLVIILFSSLFGITLTGFLDPFAVLPRSMTLFGFPAARSLVEAGRTRQAPAAQQQTPVQPVAPQQNETENTPNPNENNSENSSENSQADTQNTPQQEESNSSQDSSSFSNAPDRRSYRRGATEQEESSGDSPYGNAPDRRSIRNSTESNQGQSTHSPAETENATSANNAPDRRTMRREAQQNPQNNSRATAAGTSFRETLKNLGEKIFFVKEKRYYDYFVVNGLFILILLGLNFFRTRFWCRYMCGLGALYGIVGKYALLKMKQNENCTNCKACSRFCQGACNPDIKDDFKTAECIYCFNCLNFCKFNALEIQFGFEIPKEKEPKQIDIQKRSLVKGLGAGIASLFLFKTNFHSKRQNPALIRPPGALAEPDFLSRCIKCGNCMRICPNNFLQPTLFEAGLEGMETPIGVAKRGFCSPTCTLCSHACPTGAIRHLTEEDRGYDANGFPKMKIGTAHVNQHRCITYIYQRKCLVCEEHCPTSPKAIWKHDIKVKTSEGKYVTVGQPMVTPERCIGCGVCEYVCPVPDEPGIRITNVGEKRNRANDFSLSSQ